MNEYSYTLKLFKVMFTHMPASMKIKREYKDPEAGPLSQSFVGQISGIFSVKDIAWYMLSYDDVIYKKKSEKVTHKVK